MHTAYKGSTSGGESTTAKATIRTGGIITNKYGRPSIQLYFLLGGKTLAKRVDLPAIGTEDSQLLRLLEGAEANITLNTSKEGWVDVVI